MNVYGIGYRLEILERDSALPTVKVTSACVKGTWDDASQPGWVAKPREFKFGLPALDAFPRRTLNASDTYGVLGGVEDPYQRACSEGVERAISDALISAICGLLGAPDERESLIREGGLIAILGPPIPKIVGRCASLRLSPKIGIAWVLPDVFPKCISADITDALTLGLQLADGPLRRSGGWDDASLVYTDQRPPTVEPSDASETSWVYALDSYGRGRDVAELLKGHRWAPITHELLRGSVPREAAVASDVVDLSCRGEIAGNDIGRPLTLEMARDIADTSASARGGGWKIEYRL